MSSELPLDVATLNSPVLANTYADLSSFVEEVMKIKETTAPRHEHYSTIQSVEHVWTYDVRPFLPRILDTPTLMIVAEGDDLTMWEREVPVFGEIATSKKKLFVQQKGTHMSMYSNLSHLEIAAKEAADWYRQWLIEAK